MKKTRCFSQGGPDLRHDCLDKTSGNKSASVTGYLVRWERVKSEWNLCVIGRGPVATVYDSGNWFTWDKDGVGGENSKEETVERAKIEAAASAISQGFI